MTDAIGPKIYAALRDDAAVAALVSGPVAAVPGDGGLTSPPTDGAGLSLPRIFPLLMPPTCPLPAVTYSRVSNQATVSLTGDSGLDNARIQIDCWATTLAAADALAQAARTALFASTTFGVGDLSGPSDSYEPDTKTYRVSMDFSIWHN